MPYSTFHSTGENSNLGFGSTQKKIGKQLNYYQDRGKLHFNQENISNFIEWEGNYF